MLTFTLLSCTASWLITLAAMSALLATLSYFKAFWQQQIAAVSADERSEDWIFCCLLLWSTLSDLNCVFWVAKEKYIVKIYSTCVCSDPILIWIIVQSKIYIKCLPSFFPKSALLLLMYVLLINSKIQTKCSEICIFHNCIHLFCTLFYDDEYNH